MDVAAVSPIEVRQEGLRGQRSGHAISLIHSTAHCQFTFKSVDEGAIGAADPGNSRSRWISDGAKIVFQPFYGKLKGMPHTFIHSTQDLAELDLTAVQALVKDWMETALSIQKTAPQEAPALLDLGRKRIENHPERDRLIGTMLAMAMAAHHPEAVAWGLANAPLHLNQPMLIQTAIQCGRADWVQQLLPFVDPRFDDDAALYSAARYGHLDVVDVLLPHCDPKDHDSDALFIALQNHRWPVVDRLLPLSDLQAIYPLLMQQEKWVELDYVGPHLDSDLQHQVLAEAEQGGILDKLPSLVHAVRARMRQEALQNLPSTSPTRRLRS